MAAPLYPLGRKFYAYISDNGTTYNVGTTKDNGDAQSATPVAALANPTFPRGWKMRKVLGEATISGVVYRNSCPIFDPSSGMWTGSTASFSKAESTVFTITGRIGERRTSKGG